MDDKEFNRKIKEHEKMIKVKSFKDMLINIILEFEPFIPVNTHGINLRKEYPLTYQRLRKEKHPLNNKCEICGISSKLNCHEVYRYNDKKLIQSLIEFKFLCNNCHMYKHLGYRETLIKDKKLDEKVHILHFCKTNNCSLEFYYLYLLSFLIENPIKNKNYVLNYEKFEKEIVKDYGLELRYKNGKH